MAKIVVVDAAARSTVVRDMTAVEETRRTADGSAAVAAIAVRDADLAARAVDVATLRTYHNNAAPTAAESVAALKALIRVVRALAS